MNTLEYIRQKFGFEDFNGRQPMMIPNFTRDDMAVLFCDLGFKIGAEVGVSEGVYSETLLKANSSLKLYSVDPWSMDINFDEIPEYKLLRAYEKASARLVKYNCQIMRMSSMEAVHNFDDGSLDFVYIDGDHRFAHALEDITEWSKKIRSDGVVSGHDYQRYRGVHSVHYGVIKAVRGYTESYEITPWFVLGRRSFEPRYDKCPYSWMWVKP